MGQGVSYTVGSLQHSAMADQNLKKNPEGKAQITVPTPFGEDITLEWNDGKTTARGGESAMIYWNYLKRKGMYGMYGHTLEPDNCFFRDLVSGVSTVSPQEISLNGAAKAQVKAEVEQERRNPLPKGAVT